MMFTELPITISQAILGGKVDVLTLDGMVEMKIPAGTQPDSQLAMRGKGIKRVNGTRRGSQIVTMKVIIPKSITERQKELMEEFAEEEKSNTSGTGTTRFVTRAERLKKYMGSSAEDSSSSTKEQKTEQVNHLILICANQKLY